MPKIERFCIICNKDVAPGMEDDAFSTPPSGAVVWQAHGNYGTELFDPMDGNQYLECFICDECLKSKSSKVFHVKTKKDIEYIFHSFENQLDKEQKAIDAFNKGKAP